MAKDSVSNGLGPLIRMRNLSIDRLPSHPSLASQQNTSTQDILTFAASALHEAETFMTTYLPQKFDIKSDAKSSPPAKAPIKLLSRDISASELAKEVGAGLSDQGTESWFARESLHENKAEAGTGSWEEFDFALRVDHSAHEDAYTPDIQDAHETLTWDEELESHGRRVEGGWEDVHASVMEMQHHIPAPLNNRVFPEFVLTGKRGEEFLVVQIPVGTNGIPGAKYHNVPKVTGGMYCSIERGELVDGGKKVRWQMATASNAKGNLPMWAQKMGVPGAVVKDVGLVVQWLEERRKGKA